MSDNMSGNVSDQTSEASAAGGAQDRDRYMRSVVEHKLLVGRYMRQVIAALVERAVMHDTSKFYPAEFDLYASNYTQFERVPYGTPAYQDCMASIKPAVEHHVRNNRHHPEAHACGVSDMTLVDLVEMVCDWIAASQRVPGGRLRLDLQRERFDIDNQLARIIERTVAALTEGREGEDAA